MKKVEKMNQECLMGLFKQVGQLKHFDYEGLMIAKIDYRCVQMCDPMEAYCKVDVRSPKLTVVTCCRCNWEKHLETLKIYLMKPNEVEPEKVWHTNQKPWQVFSREQIKHFSDETGDTNSIHLNEMPVVQGLLILMKLQELQLGNHIEIKFVSPIYSDVPVYLEQEKDHFRGISGGVLCFKGRIDG